MFAVFVVPSPSFELIVTHALGLGQRTVSKNTQKVLIHVPGAEKVWSDFKEVECVIDRLFVAGAQSFSNSRCAAWKREFIIAFMELGTRNFPNGSTVFVVIAMSICLMDALVKFGDSTSILLNSRFE